jgi:serine/threonine protein kinase
MRVLPQSTGEDRDREDHDRVVGRIGRYQLIGLLATGGMAEVYLALSGELSGFRTLVVVKRILPHLSSNTEFIRMFFDEARIVALLDHPNIVRIIEVGQDGDEYFLAMEVVQGRPLSAVLRRAAKRKEPLTHAQAAFLVAQAADGLGHAHNLADADGRSLNVVHRDVSPQNILVSFEGAVKVIDFGVARALGRVTETLPGGLKGKIHYMAPEQASAGQVDRRSDVFALGVILWEALCRRRLFRRDTELETLRAIIQEPILPPSKVVRISPRLERIVMRALEKDPANRFQNAEEMALALERHAFASEGFSPKQIATKMKTLFGSDYARWKRTVATAMDLDGSPAGWRNTSGTFLRPQTVDSRSHGPTVVLHPEIAPDQRALTNTQEVPSDNLSTVSAEFTYPQAPVRRTGRWMVGGIALLGVGLAAALGHFLSSRPEPLVTLVSPAVAEIMAIPISPPPAPARVESQPRPAESVVDDPATSASDRVGKAATKIPTKASVKIGARNRPASGSTASADVFAANFVSSPPRRSPAHRPGRVAGGQSGTQPSASTSASAPTPGSCAITVGTHPWAEVWIDGKNTRSHTPYSDHISCGKHELTFKRDDLKLSKTVTVSLRAGEAIKQSFALDSD